MNIVVFADKIVGFEVAKFLISNFRDDVRLIVTTGSNTIYDLAKKVNIRTCIFESEKPIIDFCEKRVDLGVLAWWPRIISPALISMPKLGFINTHPSFLPYSRGKHYNFWTIVEGAPFGVTIHGVDQGIDSGDIISQKRIAYDWTDTGGSLYQKAQNAMIELFVEAYPKLRSGNFRKIPQNLKTGSFHHGYEIEAASHINLDRSYRARDLLNILRARTFEGYPASWFEEGGEQYEVTINIRKKKQ